jgi:drug/metabolite transporter (DMT)-like permease
MPFIALLLVLLSAVTHASWNLALKGSRDKYAFTWWMVAAGFALSLPAVFLLPVRFTPVSVGLLALSSLGEVLYFLTLSASYERLDYTVAYPVARGSAPVFIAVAAALALGERVSPLGLAGILLVSLGIFSLSKSQVPSPKSQVSGPKSEDPSPKSHVPSPRSQVSGPRSGLGLLWPLGSGASIALFSVADKAALRYFSPLALGCLSFGGTALFFFPFVFVRQAPLIGELRWHWRRVLLVAFFCLGGYALVLAAMRIAPVSYVGAARESSVLFAAVLGRAVLGEGFPLRRLLAAAVIFTGIVCLVLAR